MTVAGALPHTLYTLTDELLCEDTYCIIAKLVEACAARVQSKLYVLPVLSARSTNLSVSNELSIPGKFPKWVS